MRHVTKKKFRLKRLFSKKYAREVLGEIISDRCQRKKGEMLAPAEELLLDLIQTNKEYGHLHRRGMEKKFILLAVSLDLWPIPDWFKVKRRMVPISYDQMPMKRVDFWAASILLEEGEV